jgi:amino acid transporter
LAQDKTPERLFLRKSSGLVREISTSKAAFYNMSMSIGAAGGLIIGYLALYPLLLIAGIPLFSWTMVLVAAFMLIFGLIFVVLASAMPRSGGDYVWTSRIMHPSLAYVEAFLLIIACLGFSGYNGWVLMTSTSGNMLTGLGSSNPQFWIGLASWFLVPTNQYIVGIVMFIAMGAVMTLSARKIHTVVSVLCFVGLITMAIVFFSLIAPGSNFNSNFTSMIGKSPDDLVALANTNGMAGFLSTPFSWAMYGGLLSFAFWAFLGYNLSSYMAGELKGNVSKTTLYSILAGLGAILFTLAVYYLPMYQAGGTLAPFAWAYLYWNSPSNAPYGQLPFPTTLAAIAHPELWWFYLASGIPLMVLFNFLILVAYSILASRVVFAMSMDRMAPKWLSEVNARTSSPMRLMLLLTVGGFLFFVATVYGTSPISTLYFTTIVWLPSWLFPGLNGLLLPYRRKDLFELLSAPWNKKFAGVPLISLLGGIWSAFVVFAYGTTMIPPMLQSLTSGSGVVAQSLSTGILYAIITAIIAIGLYFVSAWWTKTKTGIDVGLIFKEIPPE